MDAVIVPATKIIKDKGYIVLKPEPKDFQVMEKFFQYKANREAREGITIRPEVSFHIEAKERTYAQNKALWQLVCIIFEANNGREPSKEEKYNLYLDIVHKYADQVPSSLTGELRPVHMSESNVYQAARLIEGAIEVLAEILDQVRPERVSRLQVDVKKIITEWHTWRGKLDRDPLDYIDYERGLAITEKIWREKHKISEASFIVGVIDKAHIVTKGSSGIEEPWNWLALLRDEHQLIHQKGWKAFIEVYPHLKGKVERAFKMAGKNLTTEEKNVSANR